MRSFLAGWLNKTMRASHEVDDASKALASSLLLMAWFVEARDPYTGGHLWRVSRYARLLGQEIGLPTADVARVCLGGFLHDLGKIGVPDAVLRKTSALNEGEYSIIRTHPELGWRMLSGHPLADLVKEAVYSHHERPDGKGYPRGLRAGEIHIDARIIGLCDAFDAMTSSRPYRTGMSRGQALAIIQSQSASQFDAELSRHFIQLGRRGLLDHTMGHSDDGIPLQACPVCGPTLVIKRSLRPGQHIYCRNCGGEFALEPAGDNANLVARPTGRVGNSQDLQPDADHELIRKVVAETVSGMPLRWMLSTDEQAPDGRVKA
ncbi:cyclic di-GMP phosphodiesterase response regulator RpfG [Pseudomonas sp. SCT]|uniref:HD-GYP domain-containing protein n=1 Tax=Pseudomonas sp. (strain SCT) TaxID=412955 RepID=UPI000EBCE639|nr:HD domain-containing phosphohydrolase [Pseudomonas sp. SCT]GCA58198.1 cyclic di-GMP phosphodiesterase response regulator RpfG [Pseudomonas sp. SCT]